MALTAAPQSDLKTMMRASPGLQMLPPEELDALVNSVDTLPPANQQSIFQTLQEEQENLTKIKTEYDEKRRVLFEQYTTELKNEEVKMARELRERMEEFDRKKEAKIMDGLLQKLDEL